MPNWKKLIVSGSDASLNSLNATAALTASGLIYPSSDGSSGQVISTDGNGNLSFSTVSGGGTALTISGSSAGGTQVSSNSFTKLQFDSDTGLNLDSIDSGATALISIGSHYRDIIVDGQVTLVATGSDQLELISGTGINITTSTTDTNSNSVSKELAFEVDNTIATTGSNSFVGDQDITGALTASSAQIANLNYPITDGADGQVLTTDGAGNLTFETVEDVYVTVKNVSGGELQKGTPVHATSSQSSGNATPVIAASASDASTMPATFVLNETLADEAEGQALLSGYLQGVDTSLFETGEVVYVGENGGFTNVKPTGSTNLIQNLGIVTKIHASNGSGWVYGSGRSNDVPNLPTGKIWVGSDTYTVTSSLIDLDETGGSINLNGDITASANMSITGDLVVAGTGSFNYIESVTGSAKIIGDAYIILNNNTPVERYAGIVVQDSGSAGVTASLEFDGQTNDWFYEYSDDGGSSTEHGVVIFGPEYQTKGTPIYNTNNTIVKGNGGHHIEDSNITDDGNTITLDSTLYVTQSRVGIGTTNPGAKLNVSGDILIDSGEYISWGTVGATSIEGSTVSNKLQFRTNSSDRMIIDASGNVGIGTTNPTSKLHISSSGDAITFERSGQETYKIIHGTSGLYFTKPNSTALGFGITQNSDFDIFDSSSSVMFRADSSSGNVGIGTTNPATWKLSVDSSDIYAASFDTSNNVGVVINGNNTTASQIIGFSNSNSTYNELHLRTNSTDTDGLYIDASGNVGIGTTNPDAKLEVNGNIRIPNAGKIVFGTAGSPNDYLELNDVNSSGKLLKLVQDGATRFDINGVNGNVYMQGDVGIGTTSPTKKLQVDGEISGSDVYINDWGSVSASLATITGNDLDGSGTTSYIPKWSDSDTLTDSNITDDGNTITLDSTLYVTQSRVGIGTTEPSQSLEVVGNAEISGRVDASQVRVEGENRSLVLTKTTDTDAHIAMITTGNDGDLDGFISSKNGYIGIGGNNGYASINLNIEKSTGYVGIGVRNPLDKLHVKRGTLRIETGDIQFYNDIDYRGKINTEDGHFTLNGLNNITFEVNDSIVGRWGSNGHFGIGTPDPDFPLDINTSDAKARIWSTSGGASALILRGGNGQILFKDTSGDNEFLMLNQGTNFVFKKTAAGSSQDYIFIQTSGSNEGNVGIGTDSPSAKLDVEGDVLIKAANLSNQENTDVDTGTETIATVTHASYDAAFFDYVVKNGTNLRAGTVMAVHDGTNVEFTDNSTKDIGDTSGVTFSVDISGTDLRLRTTTTSDNWIIKTLVRSI